MGFPSPATDYVEESLTITKICGVDVNTQVISTNSGYAVIDVSGQPAQGTMAPIRYDGSIEFAKLMGRAFITEDGEAIEGDELDDVHVLGVVTFTIIDMREDSSPV